MDPNTTNTEHVDTTQLRTGDLVLHHGMRIRLGERTEHWLPELVVHFEGTVENMPELTGPDGLAVWPLTGLLPATGPEAGTWSVQGNDLAFWIRLSA